MRMSVPVCVYVDTPGNIVREIHNSIQFWSVAREQAK